VNALSITTRIVYNKGFQVTTGILVLLMVIKEIRLLTTRIVYNKGFQVTTGILVLLMVIKEIRFFQKIGFILALKKMLKDLCAPTVINNPGSSLLK